MGKKSTYQPGKKSGVIAAGKMRWTITKRQVKGKHQVALESNLYLVSKRFCHPLLKLRLKFFILLACSCKSN